MGWNPLATQFCLELAFGVLLAMAFVPRAPVGVLFYRIMGTTALLPILVAVVAPPAVGQVPWLNAISGAGLVAALAYPCLLYTSPSPRD